MLDIEIAVTPTVAAIRIVYEGKEEGKMSKGGVAVPVTRIGKQ